MQKISAPDQSERNNNNLIPWIPIIELAVLAFTTLGTTIVLFLHSDAKMEEFRKESNAIHKEFVQEMRDFHGRLISIEERNRKQ